MWRNPQGRKHALPQLAPPSAEQARTAGWFQPVNVGSLSLADRTWVPAMVPWRATEQGEVTEDVLDWYGRFAQGQPGTLVVEATGIRDIPSGPLLRIGDERFVPGLRRLVERVRERSGGRTRLFIQLIDFLTVRRRPERERYLRRFLQVDARQRERLGVQDDDTARERLLGMPDAELRDVLTGRQWADLHNGYRERVWDMHLPHVRDLPERLPELFAAAAVRAREAGFDGVELHYAHAYTMASLLSALNVRDDGYGGSLAGRVRLPLEVYRAVREAVGEDYVVGARMLSEECIDGGSTLDDSCHFAAEFAAAGMDFLSLSRGGKFEDAKQPKVGWAVYPYTGPSGWECMPTVHGDERGPFGRNVEAARAIRARVREGGFDTKIAVAGGIVSFAQAEHVLSSGAADIVACARQSLADPDWFLKLRLGAGADVRRCSMTNYCEGLDQKHKAVTCRLWDRQGLDEPGLRTTPDGRRLVAPTWHQET